MSREDFAVELGGASLEYLDDIHQYIVDGICVSSITQMLKVRFGGKYDGIPKATLDRAADYGTAVHKSIEMYCEHGIGLMGCETETKSFETLERLHGFRVLGNEIPVILYDGGAPIAAGRLDLLIECEGLRGIADIKTTSVMDCEYLACQLNLYRLAYMQTYSDKVDMLAGVWLRHEKRRFRKIPVQPELAREIIRDFKNKKMEV